MGGSHISTVQHILSDLRGAAPLIEKIKTSAKTPIRKAIDQLPDPVRNGIRIARDFRAIFGRYPNVFFPKTFNEKVQVRKIFDRRHRLSTWADKYAVREYVRAKVGDAVLPALYHVTDDPHDIPFQKLPTQYVVKPTHGSGWIQIVRDGKTIDEQGLINQCLRWLSLNYCDLTREWAYRDIPPRIMIEEFLDDGTGLPPKDYKFFVFGGKVKVIQVDLDRFIHHTRNLYDLDWNRLDCRLLYENFGEPVARPDNLKLMIEYAEILSDSIDFVRVDLYEIGGKVYFGELTNTPENGFGRFYPSSWDELLGAFWKIRFADNLRTVWENFVLAGQPEEHIDARASLALNAGITKARG
jgi:TupA-like ATPgrasp